MPAGRPLPRRRSRWFAAVALAPVLALTATAAHAQGAWLTLPDLPTARYGPASATAPCPEGVEGLRGNCVYALGGRIGSEAQNAVEAYSPSTNAWKKLRGLPTARYAPTAATAPCPKDIAGLKGICVYAIGGRIGSDDVSTVEAYSPATNTWKALPALPAARSFAAAATAPCPKDVVGLRGICVYAVGGGFSDTVTAYSPATNMWQTLPSLDAPRDAPAAATAPCPKGVKGLHGTCVYATGGFDINTEEVLSSVEAYSPATNTWTTLTSLDTRRVAHAGASAPCPEGVEGLKGICVYAVGGFNFTDEVLNSVEAYSPATDTWRTLHSLPTARFELAGTSAPCPKDTRGLNGICVYALGGASGFPHNALSTAEAFAVGER
ncbi:Kelch repeat-containing protein [Streptomyces sp. NPDC059874]|uniref:Kelch repeat-containing protein n=1 Tax=Streptomyces sp. NPDC059874 TaxID=3346983 RepID=UPI003668340F